MTEAANILYGRTQAPKAGMRWFGPDIDVPIMMIAQVPGVTDVVSALHHMPNGAEWTIAEILKRKIAIEFQDKPEEPAGLAGDLRDEHYKQTYRTLIKTGIRTGLTWSTIESLPFTEDIKNGSAKRDEHIAAYKKSLDNIGVIQKILAEPELVKAGAAAFRFDSVMGNFMLVADWTRTGYAVLPDGSRALEYVHAHFAAFDIFMAKRHQKADGAPDIEAYKTNNSYGAAEIEAAQKFWDSVLKNDRTRQEALANMIVSGLPGAQDSFGAGASLEKKLEIFRDAVLKYKDMKVEDLRSNIDYFLKQVIPHATAAGVTLCCHPDDPSYSPFLGTPRAVGSVEGYKFLLDRGCGVGLCFGSLTPNEKNRDVMSVVRDLAEHGLSKGMTINQVFPFVHLRPVETNGKDFREGLHASHVEELWKIVYALVSFGWSGVFRPDHAPDPSVLHDLVTKVTGNEKALGNRGYSVPGRAMGANLLIGLYHAAQAQVISQKKAVDAMIAAGLLKSESKAKALEAMHKASFDSVHAAPSHILVPAALQKAA